MTILLCERVNADNEYIKLLMRAYIGASHCVVLDVQNFLFSNFVPEVLNIHWPEAIYNWRHSLPPTPATVRLISERLLHYKEQGSTIVYTCHNFLPHDTANREFDEKVYRAVLSHADVVVHHGAASVSILTEAYPECAASEHIVAPHGPYETATASVVQARAVYSLPSDKRIILNFGRQRKNKGNQFIRDAFSKLSRSDSFLFNIGARPVRTARERIMRAWQRTEARRKRLLLHLPMAQSRSRTILREVVHEEIPRIMGATDIVFLGHQAGLNSGVLCLAASYAKPVVYPKLGNFRDQIADWPWAEEYQPGNLKSAIAALERMLDRLASTRPGHLSFDNSKWLEQNSWSRHVEAIHAAVERHRKVLQ